MICGRPLTPEEKKESGRCYFLYSAVNGFSYMCLGETVLILFAVRLHCSDALIAALGAMIYFGFLLLPLGKWMTGRVGAARSQADFWVCRNVAALLVAAAAPVAYFGSLRCAQWMLLAGSFLFYGFRAAGVVMSRPLVGEICDPSGQGRFISRSWELFFASGLLALLTISGIFYLNSGLWMIFFIIVAGAVMGFFSSRFVRRIRETGQIRDAARLPIGNMLRMVWLRRAVRRQLLAGMVCNLGVILIVPISMLTLKRGYHVTDAQALLYSLVQFASSVVGSWFMSKFADRFGGRKMTLAGFYGFFLIALFWTMAPENFHWQLMMIPFVLSPCGAVVTDTALSQYFLRTVPRKEQVVASMLLSVGTGAVAGAIGMISSSILLNLAGWIGGSGTLGGYRIYFAITLMLLMVLSMGVHCLDPEPKLTEDAK